MNIFPKQMRYQAALLPAGGFPRVLAAATQQQNRKKRNKWEKRDRVLSRKVSRWLFAPQPGGAA